MRTSRSSRSSSRAPVGRLSPEREARATGAVGLRAGLFHSRFCLGIGTGSGCTRPVPCMFAEHKPTVFRIGVFRYPTRVKDPDPEHSRCPDSQATRVNRGAQAPPPALRSRSPLVHRVENETALGLREFAWRGTAIWIKVSVDDGRRTGRPPWPKLVRPDRGLDFPPEPRHLDGPSTSTARMIPHSRLAPRLIDASIPPRPTPDRRPREATTLPRTPRLESETRRRLDSPRNRAVQSARRGQPRRD